MKAAGKDIRTEGKARQSSCREMMVAKRMKMSIFIRNVLYREISLRWEKGIRHDCGPLA